MFSGSSSIEPYASGKNVMHVSLPSVSTAQASKDTDLEEGDTEHLYLEKTAKMPIFDQKMPDLITLSLLPKTQWQSLVNLDVIKVLPSLLIMKHLLIRDKYLYSWQDVCSIISLMCLCKSFAISRFAINPLSLLRNLKRCRSFYLQFRLFQGTLCLNQVRWLMRSQRMEILNIILIT